MALVQQQPASPPVEPDPAREAAVKQIERRQRFHGELMFWAVGLLVVTVVWAMTEYSNAGGWPTEGFSQSSSIPHVWNDWIIYPYLAAALFLTARARTVYGAKPISERDIEREIERQRGAR